jgi:hypothetical protein
MLPGPTPKFLVITNEAFIGGFSRELTVAHDGVLALTGFEQLSV